jgi:Fur family ferric uptake transcriptional regulator
MTRQRKVILEELRKANSHPTADEVYEIVRKRLPRISLGTIYRNLETLSRSGIIRKLELGGTQKRFDGDPEDHYHVRCINCGRLDDVPTKPIPDIEDAFRNVCDYQITGHQLVLTGLCPKCKKTKSRRV